MTLNELAAGSYRRQADACEMASRIRILPLNRAAYEFSDRPMAARLVPDTKPNDAMQMAVAAVHRVDYLLTWNVDKPSEDVDMPIVDENLKMVEEARERLLKQHGGYKGLCEFLFREDQARRRKAKLRKAKATASKRRAKTPTKRG